jgi:MptA/FolE2 family GTP cyclohydrolase
MLFPATFYDVPNQEPKVRLPLDRVSVYNQKIEVPFYDELTGETTALFEVKASVVLKAEQRGIHMSRIEQAFQNLPVGERLWSAALHTAQRIAQSQKQEQATVTLTGDVIVRRDTNVTGLPSYNKVSVLARASSGVRDEAGIGLRVTIMSACPCMQTYSLDELARTFNLTIDNPKEIIASVPVATHSQKGSVMIYLSGDPAHLADISLDSLYQVLGRATHLTSELLKRPDEYDMVRRAHMRPQFVEDVVRDVMLELGNSAPDYDDSLKLTVQAESYESIHGHDIEAETSIALGELRAILHG